MGREGKNQLPSLTHRVVSIPPTFDKREELFMFDSVAPHVNLQRQQQGEEKLVLLVQASRRILIHLKGHKFNDVGDALAGDGTFQGPDGGRGKNVLTYLVTCSLSDTEFCIFFCSKTSPLEY